MEHQETHREITVAELNVASERIEQFQRFLKLAIGDERTTTLVPSGSTVIFRAITARGEPYQLVAFQPEDNADGAWDARVTIGAKGWDWLRALESDLRPHPTAEEALDDLEHRLRGELSSERPALETRVAEPESVGATPS